MVNRYSVKRNNILKSRSNKKIKKGYSNHRKCTVGIRQKKGEVSMVEKNTKKLNSSFEENIRYMNEILPVKESFDIIRREIIIGGKASVFYYIDGFIKDEAMLKIMDSFLSITAEDLPQDAETFSKQKIPYVEVDVLKCFDDILRNVLSGTAVFFVDGYDAALCMDCRSYPARGVDEPDKDKSLRGSRDGFVETIVFNTALMRRRIRDPHLIMEMTEAGQSSRTDIAVCYMSDRVDEELLNNIKSRIEKLEVDDLRMNQQKHFSRENGSILSQNSNLQRDRIRQQPVFWKERL